MTVSGQLLGGWLVAGPPKSDAERRVIALNTTTTAALGEHRVRRQAEWGRQPRWAEAGYVFTTRTGKTFGLDRMTVCSVSS